MAARLLAAAIGTVLLAGCSGDDQIVYRDRAPFNPPADSATGYLGYYDAATKQTTCGNCHAGFQGDWRQTKHAMASAGLESSSAAQGFCYSCHTLTGNGNANAGQTVGHDAVAHATYRDVQCESCHGPGLEHVEGVGQGTVIRPLASLAMSGTGNCGDCHSGTHQPFAEEWAQSGHANVSASRASNPSCMSCHDGRGALKAWGVDANYIERDVGTGYQPTTCAVCHDPHGSSNTAQLRYSITTNDPAQNLCMQCHFRRFEPEVTTSSPHAPQGAVLLGLAGYRPPGFVYDTARIYGSHATTRNPKLCAGCHVGRFTVTDAATGAFTFQATGHLMRPIPCLDSEGKPTADKSCAYDVPSRSFLTCAASGCHGTGATDGIDIEGQRTAANLFNTVRARMKFYTDQLWIDANASGSMQAAPTDAGLLPTLRQTRPQEWSNSDNMITPAEGAEFNARLCGEYGQSNSDNSKGIHNPFLCEALLIATITYIQSYYALPAPSAGLRQALASPIGGPYAGSMHVSRGPLSR